MLDSHFANKKLLLTIELDADEFDPLKVGLKKKPVTDESAVAAAGTDVFWNTFFLSRVWKFMNGHFQSECMWPDFIITLNLRLMVGCLLICPKGITHYY